MWLFKLSTVLRLSPPPEPSSPPSALMPVYLQCKTPGCTKCPRLMDDGSGYYDYCSLRCRDQGRQLPPASIRQLLFTPMHSCMISSRCSLLFCPWETWGLYLLGNENKLKVTTMSEGFHCMLLHLLSAVFPSSFPCLCACTPTVQDSRVYQTSGADGWW